MLNLVEKDPRVSGKVSDFVSLPKIVYVNSFKEESAKKFYEDFNKACDTGQEIIPIIIDSYGGYVDALMLMADVIRNSNIKVATICTGKAMSCGSVLLSCGDEGLRFAAPLSRIMVHNMSSATWGKIPEMEIDVDESKRLQKVFFELMSTNCGHDKNYFKDQIEQRSNADWYLTPQEARRHNLVNQVKVPTFKTSISVHTTLIL